MKIFYDARDEPRNATTLAGEWLELAPPGASAVGPMPQEIRVWIVDAAPVAGSFHRLHVVPKPAGFRAFGDGPH